MKETPVEIERKYAIRMPDLAALAAMPDCSVSEIEQIYLPAALGSTHRIRRRTTAEQPVFTETVKVRIDKMSAFEDEHKIDGETYARLAATRDPATRVILKTRYAVPIGGQLYEVDVYPFWERACVLETELPDRETVVPIPPCFEVLKELTGDHRYSNASLSRKIPPEDAFFR